MFRFKSLVLAGFLVAAPGCATSAPAGPASDPKQVGLSQTPEANHQNDPFEVARIWAAQWPDHELAADLQVPEIQGFVASWSAAQVARVWAAGDAYRALINERSTADERPAVLLYISRDASGEWRVTAVKPSTSTALWSQF